MAPFKVAQPLQGDGLDLVKPFNNNDRRALTREVRRLIKKRGEMDNQMSKATKRLDQSNSAQLQQKQLLQMSARMKVKENKFIRRQSKVLADREKLFEMNPSDARARDVEILKTALLKLRGEAETPKSGRKKKSDGDGDDDDSSNDWDSEMGNPGGVNNGYYNTFENDLRKDKDATVKADGTKAGKRKRAGDAPQPSKKASNGQTSNETPQPIQEAATTVDDQPSKEESNLKMDESAKKSKIKYKNPKSISSLEAEGMEEGSIQNAAAHPKGSKDHNSITKPEFNYGFVDEIKSEKATKKEKKKKNKKSQKSKSAVTVKTEHGEKDDNSKIPTGQLLDMEKYESRSIGKAKKENVAKKNPKKKKRTKSVASVFADVIVDDADEQKGLEEWNSSPGDGSRQEADALKIVRKEKRFADDVVANMEQESPELKKPVQIMDGEQPATNEGNKTRKRRVRAMATETSSQVSHSDQDKAKNSGIYGFEATSPTANPTLKCPTRIEPQITPVAPFLETAGRTLLNPWSGFRRTFSIQNPEPVNAPEESTGGAVKAQDGQVWVLTTTGSRKKKRYRKDSDTKSVTMTIGKVDAPTKVDQGSPTPPPKKDQKKRGRPKKVKVPLMSLESRPATFQGQMSAPGVRASEDLIRLITPYAALLGSDERAESLNKLLEKDKELLREEKKTWFKAVGLPHDD
ncbi:hypothetical protein CI238_01190 [Colletotrichum incanum]|uniref:Uncharacterized protein n=1 Tax=Colletotrichum incanum TaxID=1573173 RepID=A0A161VZL4_COLIC|nr:hypothetical protein CI238_01190 [Colletotrichum incanum]